MFDLIGKTLGNYLISERIGRGGMATVYKARQQIVNREVAIKVMNDRAEPESPAYQRFLRELQIIANLEHLHILPIYDYGHVDGFPYIVMRYLDGGSLNSRVRAKNLSLADIERLVAQIAAALDHAHAKGVIHRDLKPHNVLLDRQGNAYLCDFGIAKLSGSQGLTRTGEALGTPAYMPPEQWQGLLTTPQTDIYALGVILFEMLTGEPPFEAENVFSLMYKHLHDLPPLLGAYRTDLPPAVDGVIQRALAKLPADRFQTASALAQAFSDALRATQERQAIVVQARRSTGSLKAVSPEPTAKYKAPELFVEHSWALEAFQGWRSDRSAPPVLYVVGAHGIGKSTLMRRLAELVGQRAVRYELSSDQVRSLDPRNFVDSLAWQLSAFLPARPEEPTGDALREVLMEPLEIFESRVLAPLSQLPPEPPIFLFIDALEAAFEHTGGTIVDLVRAMLQNFPEALRLVVASAPHPELELLFRNARCLALRADNNEDRNALYATLSAHFAALMPNLSSGDVDLSALIEKAQGNPLYLNVVTACLAYGQLTLADLEELPSGLDALWQMLLARLSAEDSKPIYLLAAARAPLPNRLLALLLSLEPSALSSHLALLRPLLQEAADRSAWQLTHGALRYWLLENAADRVRAAHKHLVSALQRADPEAMELYALQHLPAHALRAEGGMAAFALLTDIAFLAARLKRVSVAHVLDDLLEARLTLRAEGHLAQAAALEHVAQAVQHAIPSIGGDINALFSQLYNRLRLVPALAESLRQSAARWRGAWLRVLWSPHDEQPPEPLVVWQGAPIIGLAASRALQSAVNRLAVEKKAGANGTTWLAICADGYLRLWLDGMLSHEWLAGEGAATPLACALSADGRFALSASSDGKAHLWDLSSNFCLHTWAHKRAVLGCALSADATLALTAGEDRLLRLWDVQSGALRAEFYAHPAAVTCCAFALGANGMRLAISGDAEGKVRFWHAEGNSLIETLDAHRGAVTACAGLEERHPLVVTGGADGQLCVWDGRSGKLLRRFKGGASAVTSLALAFIGERLLLAAGNDDKALRLWDVQSGRLLARYTGHRAQLKACAIDPSGHLLSGALDGSMRLWYMPDETHKPIEAHGAAVNDLAFTPDSRRVVSASLDRELRIWQAETGELLQTMQGHIGSVNGLAVRADGRMALSAGSDRTVRAWDLDRGAQLRQYGVHNDAVTAVAFSLKPLKIGTMPRSNWLVAAGGMDRAIRLYDAESGQLVLTLRGHRDAVTACLFSPSDELLLSLGKEGSACLWSLAKGELIRSFAALESAYTAAAFHPEGALIVLGMADGTLSVFDRRSGATATFVRNSARIVACGYTPNGELLFSADAAQWLRVYVVRTQQLVATFRAAHAITCADVALNGTRFAIGDVNGGVSVLQLEGQVSGGRRRNLL
ncbi:MAG: hypothetical protein CUN49_08305 [Candidatus Thermofonsia Clade 1 bacterium]|uniref:non-specific serine/threonine protein kinase n=1 Tax=Candidatus Thermofonsia Clade 1 bacterium TaxID=2364210 RepID=A0A2M8PZ36_9CHLR|nr:MAG: hypothetical protein CUN49_08305 [Candidatus Thermofonsia Clade 1 bacterium]PJF42810.1 MAG: hypothetical protein CUN50_02655 [Candidatus Thermofonsia Clade 1 bacterium]RMF48911.1 MAG: hypothetical protein D6749_14490 [Chloroflexota bacterium]